MEETNERLNVEACGSPRCSPEAREVGRDGFSITRRHIRVPAPAPALAPNSPSQISKAASRVDFAEALNYRHNAVDRGDTRGTRYNASYSIQRVFRP